MDIKQTKQGKIICKFMGWNWYPEHMTDWNSIMKVVEKIETLIEHRIHIENSISINWSYSPKKTGTFPKGAGGGGGWTVERTPFESIFGKFHSLNVYYYKEIKFKVKEGEVAKNKQEAVVLACYRWIDWYNKTVLNIK
jgi:hypothetical protein